MSLCVAGRPHLASSKHSAPVPQWCMAVWIPGACLSHALQTALEPLRMFSAQERAVGSRTYYLLDQMNLSSLRIWRRNVASAVQSDPQKP